MSEREPSHLPCEEVGDPWDIQRIAEILGTEAVSEEHSQYGQGYRFTVAGHAEAAPIGQLKLYPDRLIARYRSPLIGLDLTHVETIDQDHGALRIHARDERAQAVVFLFPGDPQAIRVILSSEGQVPEALSLSPAPDQIVETPVAPAAEPAGAIPEDGELAPRVMLTGRLGHTPRLRTTRQGKLIARTSLAVHRGEETDWHTVLFHGERAQQAAETLSKGQLVTIIGYRHLREAMTRQNGPRTVEEIYAASIRTSSTPNVP